MDFTLRCNSLKCRTPLSDRAVVTTCSHIFCVPCSEALGGLADPNAAQRICPACETQLGNPDDAVLTQLQPSEDYKTSVLSGLSPSIIMECAGRGLSFYSYQTSQEIVYQEFLARSLTDKYSTLSTQMDSIIDEANGQIRRLQEKLSAMQIEQKSLEQKNHELQEQYRSKAKSQRQIHHMYTKLKQQQVAGGLELAAEHEAEDTLQVAGNRGAPLHSRTGSGHSGNSGGRHQTKFDVWEEQQYGGDRSGLQGARGPAAQVQASPSNHRSRLPAYGNQGPNQPAGVDGFRQGTHYRQPLQSLDPNVYGTHNVHGYRGMSSGFKVGRQQSGSMGGRSVGLGLGRSAGMSALGLC